MEEKEELLQYIRDNKTWTEEEEGRALVDVDHKRCPLRMTHDGSKIIDAIIELVSDFADEKGYDSDWTPEDFDDEEEIFWAL